MLDVRFTYGNKTSGYTREDFELYECIVDVLSKCVSKGRDCFSPKEQVWIMSVESNDDIGFDVDTMLLNMVLYKAKHNPMFKEELEDSILKWPSVITDLTLETFGVKISHNQLVKLITNQDLSKLLEKAAGLDDYRTATYLNLDIIDEFSKAYIQLTPPDVKVARVNTHRQQETTQEVEEDESLGTLILQSLLNIPEQISNSVKEAIKPERADRNRTIRYRPSVVEREITITRSKPLYTVKGDRPILYTVKKKKKNPLSKIGLFR